MKRSFVSGFAIVLPLLVAAGAWAADPMEATGRVVAKDADTFTIETDDGQRFVYAFDADTELREDGEPVQIDDVEVGDRVRVMASPAATGTPERRAAARVEVLAASAPAPDRGETGDSTLREAADRDEMEGEQDAAPRPVARPNQEPSPMARADRDDDPSEQRLPGTASPLPLVALLGGISLAAGLLLRRLRR
jgi:hypothetical protein